LLFFAQSAATLLLKNKRYFTLSFIFPSSGDVFVTAINAPAANRWPILLLAAALSHMHLLFPNVKCLCRLQCRDYSSMGEKKILFFLRTVLNLEQWKLTTHEVS
jgi:hypothetical protein